MSFARVLLFFGAIFALGAVGSVAQERAAADKAEAVLQKAVQSLGGDKYIKATSLVGRGKFSNIRDNAIISYQTFTDIIVFPDKERTEFKGSGSKTVQTNVGASGWVFDGDQELIKVQTEKQVANFRQGLRTSLDNLLRGGWRGDAELSYFGRRAGALGRRNDVIRLTYKDGFAVEFEIADDGTPVKAIYKTAASDGTEIIEEDRYGQFVEVDGIKAPFIVDRFSGGRHASRINYDTIEFNRRIPDSIFAKPSSPKELKKDIQF